jgi:hypothetical protein
MESVSFNGVWGETPAGFLCRIDKIQMTEKSSVRGRYKNSVLLEITEIIQEFLLPLMRFAVSMARAASEMGPEAVSLGGSQWRKGSFYKEGSRKDGAHLGRRLLRLSGPLS